MTRELIYFGATTAKRATKFVSFIWFWHPSLHLPHRCFLYFLTIPIDCCLYYLPCSFLGSLILSDFGAIFFSWLLIENQNYSQIFLVSFLLWRLSLALLSLLPFAPGPIIHSRFQCPADCFWLQLCTVLWEPKCVSQPKKVKQFFTIYTD